MHKSHHLQHLKCQNTPVCSPNPTLVREVASSLGRTRGLLSPCGFTLTFLSSVISLPSPLPLPFPFEPVRSDPSRSLACCLIFLFHPLSYLSLSQYTYTQRANRLFIYSRDKLGELFILQSKLVLGSRVISKSCSVQQDTC